MAVGPFLYLLERNLLTAVDPSTPPGSHRYAQQLSSQVRAVGASARREGTRVSGEQEPGCQGLTADVQEATGPSDIHIVAFLPATPILACFEILILAKEP